jgi:hypothetical protein
VRKLLIFFLGFSLASAVTILSSGWVFAGQSTLSIPPTVEGPGLILPDSPLYPLDLVKQNFRLLLAFTPEQKARAHNAIAGERMAELRIMLAKNNVKGIRTALQGVSDNLKAASENLADARLTGRNINSLAEEINNSIKEKQKTLSVLRSQAAGEVRAQVFAAEEGLKVAKVNVKEDLPAGLLTNETIDDLNMQINKNIASASLSASEINHALEVLTRLASNGAVIYKPKLNNLIDELKMAQTSISEEVPTAATTKSTKK